MRDVLAQRAFLGAAREVPVVQASTPESIVLRFVERINVGDLDGIAALTAPVYTFTNMEGDVYVVEGAEAVRASWAEYPAADPEYKILVQHVLKGGDGIASLGRRTGSHLPAPVERNELALWIAEVEDGHVSRGGSTPPPCAKGPETAQPGHNG